VNRRYGARARGAQGRATPSAGSTPSVNARQADPRCKLDVPKERFISYPGCESDEDHKPVYGWAGWDHLQQAQALAGLYEQRKSEGWEKERAYTHVGWHLGAAALAETVA